MPRNAERHTDWMTRLIVAVVPWLVRLHTLTLRVRYEGLRHLEQRIERGLPVVVAGWHQQLYFGIATLARYGGVIMISESRDGERIARVVERLGWTPVRGSSSRGSVRALVELIRLVRRGASAIHIVDGPRGPARQVKPGLVLLASRAGAAIVPAFGAARHRWRARSWDRFQVPLPFTRVVVRLDAPIEVPAELSESDAEAIRQEVEKRLERGHAELEAARRA